MNNKRKFVDSLDGELLSGHFWTQQIISFLLKET